MFIYCAALIYILLPAFWSCNSGGILESKSASLIPRGSKSAILWPVIYTNNVINDSINKDPDNMSTCIPHAHCEDKCSY